jgi:lipopolysaccharide transport system permease protein
MNKISTFLKGPIFVILLNRNLIVSLAIRDLSSRYRGSYLGYFWSLVTPLVMLVLYTFIFKNVFGSKWPVENLTNASFAMILYTGITTFNIFSECILKAPNLVLNNVSYVKKIVFPLDALPWISIVQSLFHALMAFLVWIAAYFLLIGQPSIKILLLPIIVTPLIFITLGFAWLLSSIGVYVKDLSEFLGSVIAGLMFLSPIFYPITAIPEEFRYLIYLNPVTPTINFVRDILNWNLPIDWFFWAKYAVVSYIFSCFGLLWFQKTRVGFADVL